MKESLITVIIPCYNAAEFVENCLDSLSQQTFKNFDVIAVDDCSTDGTYEFLKKYQSKTELRLAILNNEVNSGPASSREKAAEYASSEYLCFCDADDTYSTDFLKQIGDAIKRNNPSLIITGYTLVMKNGRKTVKFAKKNKYDVGKEKAFLSRVNSLWALAVRRNVFLSVKHPDIRNGEDMAVIPLMISQSECIDILSNASYQYNCRGGSASRTSNMKVVESLLVSFRHIDSNLPLQYYDFAEFLAIKNVLYGCLLNLFKFSFNVRKAKEIILEIEEKYPDWYKNKYFKSLPKQRQVFVFFIKHRLFFMLKLFSELHKFSIR